jgi:hypothetical protein
MPQVQFVVVYTSQHGGAATKRNATFTAETQEAAETFGRDYVKSIGRIEGGGKMTFVEVRPVR